MQLIDALNGSVQFLSVQLHTPQVNLRNLSEVIDAMPIIHDGSADAISEYQANKNDMQSDFGNP